MKVTLKQILASLLLPAVLAFTINATAQSQFVNGRLVDDIPNVFAVGTTNPATTLSYLVVPARSGNGGAPVVTFLNAGSDLASSVVTFYRVTDSTTAQYATNATTTLSVNRTNNFVSGDTILIRHKNNETYEKRTLTTMTGSTNLVVTVAPIGAVIPGDIIYRVTSAGVIPWGATTNSISPGPVISGQKGLPLLIEINSTSTSGRLVAGGRYE